MNFKIDESWRGKQIAALDVATQSTGWAVWDGEKFYVGSVQPKSPYVYKRIQDLQKMLFYSVAFNFQLDMVVMEAGFAETGESLFCPKCNERIYGATSFFDRSAEVTMMLAEARGAAAAAFSCPIMKIGNTSWKKALGIQTAAKLKRDTVKYEVYLAACEMWGKDLPITMLKKKATYDESDAAAILAVVLRDMRYDG